MGRWGIFKWPQMGDFGWPSGVTYSLLWILDSHKNPLGRLPTKLTISYVGGDVPVTPPSAMVLSGFKYSIINRTKAAIEMIAQHPPKAFPSVENCRTCGIRHLCNEYWKSETQNLLVNNYLTNSLMDIEVAIENTHGSRSYDAICICCRKIAHGSALSVRIYESTMAFQKGDRIRLLGVHLSNACEDIDDSKGKPPIISVNKSSEFFFLPNDSSARVARRNRS